jgi:hypothetical protein
MMEHRFKSISFFKILHNRANCNNFTKKPSLRVVKAHLVIKKSWHGLALVGASWRGFALHNRVVHKKCLYGPETHGWHGWHGFPETH